MITIFVLFSLAAVTALAFGLSEGTFVASQLGSISSDVEISEETPKGVLAEQLQRGDINREVYEIFTSEKFGTRLA
jgi:hypothetical protein